MFKLVIISALISIAVAKPSVGHFEPIVKTALISEKVPVVKTALISERVPVIKSALISEPARIEVKEPVVTKVGDIVRSVPTGISHQQSTIVHQKSFTEPILAHGVKSYSIPTVRTYTAPVLSKEIRTYEAPILRHVVPSVTAFAEAPLLKTYERAPLLDARLSYLNAPILKSYGGYYGGFGAPIAGSLSPLLRSGWE